MPLLSVGRHGISVTRGLGLLKESVLPVKFWQTASLWMGKVATTLALPVTHLQVWRGQKEPLIQDRLTPSYCVGRNTLISLFDSERWFCEPYI